MSVDGILNFNKPGGRTSFSIVAWLKRLSGEKHVGHTGTLDPLAEGVLPVCFGQATRVAQFLTGSDKAYLAEIGLGVVTDTFDREGEIIHCGDPGGITVTQIEEALATFRGVIEQVPPKYSALKFQGRRYYELAREGVAVEPKPRQVKIIRLELIEYKLPVMTIRVECSKGTYIRSLAYDVGRYLGCGAHLKDLTRIRCGSFYIEDALSMTEVNNRFLQGTWRDILHPVDSPLLSWRAVIVGKEDEFAIRNGCSVSLNEEYSPSEEYCRAYSLDGYFIAVLRFVSDKKLWHPEKVFSIR